MGAIIQGRLGIDLCFPEDEILIQTLMRLHRLESEKTQTAVLWALVADAPFDAVICDADSPFLEHEAQNRPWPILRLASHGRRHSGLNCLPRPISADALYNWLSRIAQTLEKTPEQVEKVAATPPVVPPAREPLLASGTLQTATKAAVATCALEDGPFSGHIRTFPPSAAAEPAPWPDTVGLDSQTSEPEPGVETARAPIPTLEETLAEQVSHGDSAQPEPCLEPTAHYQLKQWPPASLLMNEYKSVRIASVLSRHPLRIKDVSSITGASKAQCEQFLQKLLEMGLLKRCTAEDVERAFSQNASKFISKAQAAEGNPQLAQEAERTLAARTGSNHSAQSESRGFFSSLRKKLGLSL